VGHDLPQVVGVNRVENVEEVLTRWALVLRVGVREVLRKLLVALELRVELADTKLIVVGDCDLIDGGLLEQLLLPTQNSLEKVLVHSRLVRQIVLQMSMES
jgi:hypothetical protein